MKTTLELQDVIIRLAEKHGFDLNQSEHCLKLYLEGFMSLVIERIAPDQISVWHYQLHGDRMRDPEVVFFTGQEQWVPLRLEQSPGVCQFIMTATDDNTSIETIASIRQADLTRYCRIWAHNLHRQGWLEHSRRYSPMFTQQGWLEHSCR